MENPKILIYDGSFSGFLTAIYISFEEGMHVANIQSSREVQKGLFSETVTVLTQTPKAQRVWEGIQKKSHAAMKAIYFAYLSETKGIELMLYHYILSMYSGSQEVSADGMEGINLKIQQYSRMVAREKHRIEAVANFQISRDQIYFSTVAPYFNVLPLISKYYRSKYKGQEFIIYDTKRKYAIHYNLTTVEIISLELSTQDFAQDVSNINIKSLIYNKCYPQLANEPRVPYCNERTAV